MSNFLCLICGNCGSKNSSGVNGDNELNGSSISNQLSVIFILKNLLQLPSSQLEHFLVNHGNPENWIGLCDKCSKLTGEARSLHLNILQVSSKLRDLKIKIVDEIIKGPINSLQLTKLKSSLKTTVWKETRSFVQKHDYNFNKVATSAAHHHHQQCPNCLTQIQILPQNPSFSEEEPEAVQFHQCLYCPSEFPSISSVLRHIQTVHEMQRLPCLYPDCDATLKNMKNFWKHRQGHKRKEEAIASTSKTTTKKLESKEEESSSNDFNDDDDHHHHHFDNQEEKDNLQTQNMKVTTPETPSQDLDDLQDNLDDNDWLPSEQEEEAEEDQLEIDVKPQVKVETTPLPKVTEDPSCFTTIIKGGTRTLQNCPQCPLKFNSISSTLKHLSTAHHLKKLPCLHPGCTSTLSSIKAYYFHRKLHLYPEKRKTRGGAKGPYNKKDKVTVTEQMDGPCLCDLCGASFGKKINLKRHKIVVHLKRWKSVEKKVPCQFCGVTFISGYLKKHILFKHRGEEGQGQFFRCGVVGCKLNFMTQDGLDKHRVKKHGGGDDGGQGAAQAQLKQLKCSYCGKGFCFKRKLEQHELSHRNAQLGIRPFVCELCGKGFGVPQNLKNHLNYTHKLAKKFNTDPSVNK